MNLDDLLEETAGITGGGGKPQKLIASSGGSGDGMAFQQDNGGEDDWGDTSIPAKNPMINKAKSTKVEESKDVEDDWGDLQMNQQNTHVIKMGNMKEEQQKEPEDDWGIITPAPPKKKKIEEIGVISRKQEDPDQEDEWGDTTGNKFKLKDENVTQYYDATTLEPKLMKNSESKMNGTKCFPLAIGGANMEHGLTEDSMMPRSCSSLRCYKCDKKVQRFINGQWHATVDYMFVRNHNTNVAKLQEGVLYQPGWSAYACQCQFISLEGPNKEICEDMKWMCGGH